MLTGIIESMTERTELRNVGNWTRPVQIHAGATAPYALPEHPDEGAEAAGRPCGPRPNPPLARSARGA